MDYTRYASHFHCNFNTSVIIHYVCGRLVNVRVTRCWWFLYSLLINRIKGGFQRCCLFPYLSVLWVSLDRPCHHTGIPFELLLNYSLDILVTAGGRTSFATFFLFFPTTLGRNVTLSVGYAPGSSSTQSGLNVNVSRDVPKKKSTFLSLSLNFLSSSSFPLHLVNSISFPSFILLSMLSWLFLPTYIYFSFYTPPPFVCLSVPPFHTVLAFCFLGCHLLSIFTFFIIPLCPCSCPLFCILIHIFILLNLFAFVFLSLSLFAVLFLSYVSLAQACVSGLPVICLSLVGLTAFYSLNLNSVYLFIFLYLLLHSWMLNV